MDVNGRQSHLNGRQWTSMDVNALFWNCPSHLGIAIVRFWDRSLRFWTSKDVNGYVNGYVNGCQWARQRTSMDINDINGCQWPH